MELATSKVGQRHPLELLGGSMSVLTAVSNQLSRSLGALKVIEQKERPPLVRATAPSYLGA